jgi:hypothetical protein
MTEFVQRFVELDLILDALQARIDKVHAIMYAQDIELLTPKIEDYRVKYLESLKQHRKSIAAQQNELLQQIDINEIITVL